MSSRGTVLPTTYGRLSVSSAKKTTSELVACWIARARESLISYAATSVPCGAAVGLSRSGVPTAMNILF
ncbi:MAG: hypothetical protein DMD41_02055 [Gemmatimonadetes bacterium]|nr:MAG: hypothetical protein DMD41_02055 [Gemmatimonadota bacterium]